MSRGRIRTLVIASIHLAGAGLGVVAGAAQQTPGSAPAVTLSTDSTRVGERLDLTFRIRLAPDQVLHAPDTLPSSANVESLRNLEQNLKTQGYDIRSIPYVLQLNKRDLPTAVDAEEMAHVLRYKNEPVFEAVAFKGIGVFDTLKACAKQVLIELKKGR